MFRLIRSKIAVKLALIISIVVCVISIAFSFYLNRLNIKKLYASLENTINITAAYLEVGFSQPLWDVDSHAIEIMNSGILNTKEIIAINVFEKSKFISGYEKLVNDGSVFKQKLKKPYVLPEDGENIKKVTREIFYNAELIGKFELYYTQEHIISLNRESSIRMVFYMILMALFIVFIIYGVLKFLVINPIINLAYTTQQIASTRDYSFKVNRIGTDEISMLYNGFNDMLSQILMKESERESIYEKLQESEKNYRYLFDRLKNAIDKKDFERVCAIDEDTNEHVASLNMILGMLDKAETETQNRDWIKTGQTNVSEKISGEQKIGELCHHAITYVAGYIGAHVGTFFVREGKTDWLYLAASYAYKPHKGLTERFMLGEGLVGQAALEKKRIIFKEVPEDYIRIESSLGNIPPKNILVLPLIFEDEVLGVIELGAAFEFTPLHIEFADLVGDIIAVAVNAAQFNAQLQKLLDQTKAQSEELKAQQKELKKANVELEEQAWVLKNSEAKLQVQQEELQASNEEMEEKNEMLERQKEEINKKNLVLEEKSRELEEKAKQLQLATKYKSEFLANMSHELRTPLNSMLLLAKMLSDNEARNLTSEEVESAASIYRSGNTLLRLINDILDLSKIEARKIELSVSDVHILNLVGNIKNEFKYIAKEKKLKFEIEVQDGLPDKIVTDVYRVEQIIRNLLSNSFKFTEYGSVKLKVGRPGDNIKFLRPDLDIKRTIAFTVSDTGPGIPAEKLDLIFEAFKQVDGTISRRHGGTGLGLSISKELALLLGGELEADSLSEKGALFTLYIPEILKPASTWGKNAAAASDRQAEAVKRIPEIVKRPLPEKETGIESKGEAAQYRSPKSMLIIEDDSEFANILAAFFQKKGYESVIASDGETGIKYVIEHKPTAVILDIGLPGIDGWAVLNELKSNPETRHIPVHIMSAYDNKKEGMQRGAVGYLTKPVSTKDLSSALNKIESVLKSEVKELLVVEDDKDLRESIMKLMGTHDIVATAAGTGDEAMQKLKSKRYDCMILDLGLPDISGFDFLDKMEADSEIEKTPVIIYTGRDLSREEAEKLEKYSASIVLKSAVSMERLLDETALFMHRIETDMPEEHQQMIRKLRDKESVLTGKKVLLVDDDMRNAFALNKFLKSKGMEVTLADNGKKALELLKTDLMPDIILMDIMMPVMNGYESIKQIRKQAKFKDMPILALTAKAMDTDREKCIKCGANDYLSKPIDVSKLLSILRVWLYS